MSQLSFLGLYQNDLWLFLVLEQKVFQPVIITLPDGTNFQATAVVSADRRYVRVTPVPFFSGVTRVSTFSFTGAGTDDVNDDGNDGGNNPGGNNPF